MAVTNYYTVNGEIIGEKTAGGTRVDYLTDALGSVTATVNSSAQVVNTYRYKPYGKQLAKTGTGADPAFTWVGSQGYRPTQRKFSDFYVRARHPDTSTGRWTTRDLDVFVDIQGYIYVNNRPVAIVDPSGLSPVCEQEMPPEPCASLIDPGKIGDAKDLIDCLKKAGFSRPEAKKCIDKYAKGLKDKGLEQLAKYIGCVGGACAVPNGPLCGELLDPCNPPKERSCQECCYSKYLTDLIMCQKKHWGWGIIRCVYQAYADIDTCVATKCNE